jgi:hypothetical protein
VFQENFLKKTNLEREVINNLTAEQEIQGLDNPDKLPSAKKQQLLLKDISNRLDKVILDKTASDALIIAELKTIDATTKTGSDTLAVVFADLATKADNTGLRKYLKDLSESASKGLDELAKKLAVAKLEIGSPAEIPLTDLKNIGHISGVEVDLGKGTFANSTLSKDAFINEGRLLLTDKDGTEIVATGSTDVPLSYNERKMLVLNGDTLKALPASYTPEEALKVHNIYLSLLKKKVIDGKNYNGGSTKFKFLREVGGDKITFPPSGGPATTPKPRPATTPIKTSSSSSSSTPPLERGTPPPSAWSTGKRPAFGKSPLPTADEAFTPVVTKSTKKRGKGLKKTKCDNVDNVERLKTLIGSIHAGNKNNKPLKNELMQILDDLLRTKKLTKADHAKLYKQYVQ